MEHLLDESRRIAWVDYMKGLSIILVVLGHSYLGHRDVEAVGWAFRSIYAFHMPLFFVLAGVTSAVSLLGRGSIALFAKGRVIGIFVPYLCWSFFRPIVFADKNEIASYSVEQQIHSFVTGDVNLWFLPALLLLQVYYCCFYLVTRQVKSTVLQLVLAGGIIVVAFVLHRLFGKTAEHETHALQWLTSAYTYSIAFFFGAFLVHYKKIYQVAVGNRYVIAFALLILLVFSSIAGYFPYAQYSKLLSGMCAAIILIRLFRRWKGESKVKGQLKLIGQYSLIIYIASALFESSSLNLLLEGMNATFVQLAYAIVAVLICYVCILFAKFIELSDILSFFLLGKSIKKG